MALKTEGFRLSEMPRAPKVPGNIGVVDVGAIDKAVRERLQTFETIRQLPQSMALADESATTNIAKNQSLRAGFPLAERRDVANTVALEQQLPLKAQILTAEASPEMLEAKRQALINKSVKQPSGDVQMATSLAAARQRLAEDPSDPHAAQLVAVLEPMVLNKSATSARNPEGAIQAGITKTGMTTAATRDVAQLGADTKIGVSDADRAARERIAASGQDTSRDVAKIGAEGRINAAKAANLNKAYTTAAEQNQSIQSALGSLALLEDKADQYLASGLGSGPVVGSAPGLFVRGLFGDTTGQELKAAIGQEMTNAVKTVQGLGAMSNIEFGAVMEQLPKPSDQPEAILTKLEYLKAVRPWLAARSNLYMTELEKGTSPVAAYQKVRTAFPVPPVAGVQQLEPPGITAPTAPIQSTGAAPGAPSGSTASRAFTTPAEADAAAARGEIKPGDKITVGGVPGTWQ